MHARETSLFWHFDYARLDYLHFVLRGAGTTAAEGQRASVADYCDVNGDGGTRRNDSRSCPAKYRRHGKGGASAVGSVAWHRILPCGGWHQPDAAAVDRNRGNSRHPFLMEHRAPRKGVFRILSGTHRWRVWRVPELRSISAICFLRNRHHPEILSHCYLGFDPARVCRNEACALLIRWQRDGAHRIDCGIRGRGRKDHEPH